MARFPRTEAEIVTLAQAMVSGLTGAPGLPYVYPSPPVAPAELTALISAYTTARNAAIAAQAEAEEATTAKDEALEDLADAMKSDIRYAENTVDFDDDLLKLLGWAGRAAAAALVAPGQPRTLEAPQQGDGWVFLDWKKPIDGGAVKAYKVERRERPAGDYEEVKTAYESEVILINQERGKEWEYRIVAGNKAGDGPPSNTVPVVL